MDSPVTNTRERLQNECLAYLEPLYRTALRMTRNREDAEDLVQETYLKAVGSIRQLKETAHCKAWLFKILTNLYIDNYRRRRRRPEEVAIEGMEDQIPKEMNVFEMFPPQDATLGEYLKVMVSDEVKGALEELPEAYRLAVILSDVEGFSYQEIAEVLDVPLGTVMSRLFRGRRLLKDALLRYAQAHGYGGGS